jgi:tRNA modification GTPase
MIRLSGPYTKRCACELFHVELQERGRYIGSCGLSNQCSIPIQLLWYPGPKSYTGEDTIEILLPGNPHLVRRLLDLLLDTGHVDMAQPGEFSARAYLNQHLTLQQAEGIALRISAESTDALEAANSLLSGSYGQQCDEWAQELATLLALVEAGVDFSDQEDVIPIAPVDLANRLRSLEQSIVAQTGSELGDRVQTDHPRVVLVGRPNAGKSSLFNALLSMRRAAVSDQAGTTRDAITEILDLSRDVPGAGSVELVDLAGLAEESIDSIDANAQSLAREMVTSASAAIWCDPSGRFDESLVMIPSEVPVMRVRTKSDLPFAGSKGRETQSLAVCALDGTAITTLKRAIADAVTLRSGSGVGVFVPRHRRALRDAARGVEAAIGAFGSSDRIIAEPELVALHLREGLDALGELIGEISPDDVIGRVFATFCVGK